MDSATHSHMMRYVALLVLFTLIRSLLYRAVTPPWQGPDEPGHFELVGFIAELGRVPVDANDVAPEVTRRVTLSTREHWGKVFQHNWPDLDFALAQNPPGLPGPRQSGYQLPLYYQLLTPLYQWTVHQTVLEQYYALSLTSSFLAAATVLLAAYAARLIFPDDSSLQLTVPTLVAFWPQQGFMSSVINNDNLATLIAAATITAIFHLLRHGLRAATVTTIISGCLLAPLVKRTVFFLIPLSAVSLVIWGLRWWSVRRGWRITARFWLFGLASAGVVLIAIITGGRWAALELFRQPLPMAQTVAGFVLYFTDGPPVPPDLWASLPIRLLTALGNIWSQFGWGRPLLPDWNYPMVAVTVLVALAGFSALVARAGSPGRRLTTTQSLSLLICGLAVALAFMQSVVVAVVLPRYNPPGRYMMAVLIPMSVLLVAGWHEMVPPRWQSFLPQILLAALIMQDTVSLSLTLIPYFYG